LPGGTPPASCGRLRLSVTLYKEQWTKLLDMADEIRVFIKEHDAELKAKPPA
jgi:hypothetical protein